MYPFPSWGTVKAAAHSANESINYYALVLAEKKKMNAASPGPMDHFDST
jgi:hypothetical protein